MKFILNSHNSLLHRQEVVAKKSYPSNPTYDQVKEEIAKHFKKEVDCIAIRSVKGSFGSSEFTIEARVYDSAEHLQSTEPRPKVKKTGGSS